MTALVISGNPRPGSRTLRLAVAVASAVTGSSPAVVDVGELGPGLLTPGDPATRAALEAIAAAEELIVATPTYKGSYTGILKALLDQLPAQALAGKTALPVVTAGVAQQADAAAELLIRLLHELGATVREPGVRAAEPDLADIEAFAKQFA
jgi:FMN reductase